MSKVGKIDLGTFEKFVSMRLGRSNPRVIVPPLTGVDAAVVDIEHDRVLVIAEDPIFPMPGEDFTDFGWYTVHIGASDVAVMGVKPQFMTYTLLMPPETRDDQFRDIIDSIHRTAFELDIAIVGGHTGYYPAVAVPIIGGITIFSIADRNGFVSPMGARPGDDVIITKGPAVEATGILAVIYEKELMEHLGSSVVEKGKAHMKQMTVVKDALTAMSCGGVTAMHDATEGGVVGGLFEVASASGVGMSIDEKRFPFPEEIDLVMGHFGIDPLEAISEGTLIITARPGAGQKIIDALEGAGIDAAMAGTVLPAEEGRKIIRRDDSIEDLRVPARDPFWPVFFRGLNHS